MARRSHETGARIGAGNHQRLAQLALVVTELGRARYGEAYRLSNLLLAEDPLGLTNDALPNLVEAAARDPRPVRQRRRHGQLTESVRDGR